MMLASTLIFLSTAAFAFAKCPSGGIRGLKSNTCYKFFTSTTWADARQQCTAEGGTLAVVTNAFVDVLLASVPRDVCRPVDDNYYWLGASIGVDDADAWKPQWQWVDGSNFSYAAWAPGQPSNKIPQCLSFNAADNARWYSADCNKDLPFICQFIDAPAPTKVPPSGRTPAPGSTTCRSGWTYYEQTEKCYKASVDTSEILEF
ncbi:Protein CLEC-51 [Aphelenchoides avenae]|nr:Protein CLEC-51 [Aphelenchus avenae]